MATRNFFDLLGDDEHEDPAQIVVRAIPEEVKPAAGDAKKPAAAAAKLRTKPVTTNEAGRDGQRGEYDGGRGGRGGRGGGRGGRGNYGDYREGGFGFLREEGSHRDRIYYNNDRSGSNNTRDADGFVDKPVRTGHGEGRSASSYDGGRGGGGRGRGRGGRGYGEGDYRSRRREFDELSGNPRNVTEKRDADPSLIQGSPKAAKEEDKPAAEGEAEKNPDILPKATAEEGAAEPVREEEDNEMSLEEYEKALEEKRKALEGEKAAERKVEVDKAFETMQLVDNKKRDEDFFIKLGQEKEKEKEKEKGKREAAEREEKSRKPVSINEFLKPAEGEKYYGPPSSRGRGGRGGRAERREGGGRGEREYNPNHGSFGGGRFGGEGRGAAAPKIEDQNQFPTLGGK